MLSPRVSDFGTKDVDLHGKGEGAHTPLQCHDCLNRGSLLKVAPCAQMRGVLLADAQQGITQAEPLKSVPGRKCGEQYVACRTDNTEMGLVSIMIFFTLLYFVLCAPSPCPFHSFSLQQPCAASGCST